MPLWATRPRLDKRALADKAARRHLDDGVTKQDAMATAQVGWKRFGDALRRLQAERAAGGRP